MLARPSNRVHQVRSRHGILSFPSFPKILDPFSVPLRTSYPYRRDPPADQPAARYRLRANVCATSELRVMSSPGQWLTYKERTEASSTNESTLWPQWPLKVIVQAAPALITVVWAILYQQRSTRTKKSWWFSVIEETANIYKTMSY